MIYLCMKKKKKESRLNNSKVRQSEANKQPEVTKGKTIVLLPGQDAFQWNDSPPPNPLPID